MLEIVNVTRIRSVAKKSLTKTLLICWGAYHGSEAVSICQQIWPSPFRNKNRVFDPCSSKHLVIRHSLRGSQVFSGKGKRLIIRLSCLVCHGHTDTLTQRVLLILRAYARRPVGFVLRCEKIFASEPKCIYFRQRNLHQVPSIHAGQRRSSESTCTQRHVAL